MSHFTNMKTSFQNLSYLEKALNKLRIHHQLQFTSSSLHEQKRNIVVPQSNGHDIVFRWNTQEYELVVDMSFWQQPYPIESFIDKIAQQYASEVVVDESQKLGFQPVRYHRNLDGSNTIVLERWNEKDFL